MESSGKRWRRGRSVTSYLPRQNRFDLGKNVFNLLLIKNQSRIIGNKKKPPPPLSCSHSSSHLVSTAPSSSRVGLLILFQRGVPPKFCNVTLSQGLWFFMNCSTPSLTPTTTQPSLWSDKTLTSISMFTIQEKMLLSKYMASCVSKGIELHFPVHIPFGSELLEATGVPQFNSS